MPQASTITSRKKNVYVWEEGEKREGRRKGAISPKKGKKKRGGRKRNVHAISFASFLPLSDKREGRGNLKGILYFSRPLKKGKGKKEKSWRSSVIVELIRRMRREEKRRNGLLDSQC